MEICFVIIFIYTIFPCTSKQAQIFPFLSDILDLIGTKICIEIQQLTKTLYYGDHSLLDTIC